MFTRGYLFPESNVNAGHIFYDKSRNKYYRFQGGSANNPSNWKEIKIGIPTKPYCHAVPNDFDRLSQADRGKVWYNTTSETLKLWNGERVVTLDEDYTEEQAAPPLPPPAPAKLPPPPETSKRSARLK